MRSDATRIVKRSDLDNEAGAHAPTCVVGLNARAPDSCPRGGEDDRAYRTGHAFLTSLFYAALITEVNEDTHLPA